MVLIFPIVEMVPGGVTGRKGSKDAPEKFVKTNARV